MKDFGLRQFVDLFNSSPIRAAAMLLVMALAATNTLAFETAIEVPLSGLSQPKRMQKVDGPNCINHALLQLGLNDFQRYTAVSELQVLLDSPLCKAAPQAQDLKYNLGLLTLQNRSPLVAITAHAFIRLNSDLGFEKRGSGIQEPIRTVKISSIMNEYGEEFTVHYFKCTPLDAWLKQNSFPGYGNTLTQKLNELRKIELALHKAVYTGHSEKLSQQIESQILALAHDLSRSLRHQILTADELIIYRILLSRIVSMSYQLGQLGRSTLLVKTAPWLFTNVGIEKLLPILIQDYSR